MDPGHYILFCYTFCFKKKNFIGRQIYCWRFHIKQLQKQDNDRTTWRGRQKERSERKWVMCCLPQALRWVFLNMFLNTVWDFTTCPSFGLHPALHSFILSTLMLFGLNTWLPFLAVCLALLLLLWLLLAPNCALFILSTFLFFPSIFIYTTLTSFSHLPPPASSVMVFLRPLLFCIKIRSEGVYQNTPPTPNFLVSLPPKKNP